MNTDSYWPTVVAELEKCGVSIKQIADEIGLAISSVIRSLKRLT